MLCCTSAPPTTRMSRSPEMCGFGSAARCSPSTWPGARLRTGRAVSSLVCEGMGPQVSLVDALEVAGGGIDGRVGAQPALLLGGDGFAIAVRCADGGCDERGVALPDHLIGPRQDVADVGVIGA